MDSEAMSFAKDSKKLENPNMFIGDTSDTCYTTNSKYGFNNIREDTTNDNIIDVSGSGIEGTIVGNIIGTICKKKFQEVKYVTIKDIVQIPNYTYNLFILTRIMDQGWMLGGDSNSIWITKVDQQVKFDIKIKTHK